MQHFIKRNKYAIIALSSIPIIVFYVLITFFKNLSDGDIAVLVGAILTYYATIFLGWVAIYQNDKLNSLNEKLLKLESEDRATYIDFDNNRNDLTVYFENKEVDIVAEDAFVFYAEYNSKSYENDTISFELYLINKSNHSTSVKLEDFEITLKGIHFKAACNSNYTLMLPDKSKKVYIKANGLKQHLSELPEKKFPQSVLVLGFNFKLGLCVKNRFDVTRHEDLFGYTKENLKNPHTTDIHRYYLFRCGDQNRSQLEN